MNAIIKTHCSLCGTEMELRFKYSGHGAPTEDTQEVTAWCTSGTCKHYGIQYEAPRVKLLEKQK